MLVMFYLCGKILNNILASVDIQKHSNNKVGSRFTY